MEPSKVSVVRVAYGLLGYTYLRPKLGEMVKKKKIFKPPYFPSDEESSGKNSSVNFPFLGRGLEKLSSASELYQFLLKSREHSIQI